MPPTTPPAMAVVFGWADGAAAMAAVEDEETIRDAVENESGPVEAAFEEVLEAALEAECEKDEEDGEEAILTLDEEETVEEVGEDVEAIAAGV